MRNAEVIETNLDFTSLTPRNQTDQIVVHHLGIVDGDGTPIDRVLTASQIHQEHLNQGWAGIGYHYIIMPDGTIQRGRPHGMLGAHCQGDNYHTIGIVFSNTYMGDIEPTGAQIEAAALLVANLCSIYDIDIQNDTQYNVVKGHRDFLATDCPGENLYPLIQTIAQKAIWYQQN